MTRAPSTVVMRNKKTSFEKSAAAWQRKVNRQEYIIKTATYMLDQEWVTGEARASWKKDLTGAQQTLAKLMED